MVGVSLQDLPPTAQAAWSDLRDRLRTVLGDELVAIWAHGGTTSIGDPSHAGDLDTYVILSRRPDEPTARRIERAHKATAKEHAIDWDAWYVLADDARRPALRRTRGEKVVVTHRGPSIGRTGSPAATSTSTAPSRPTSSLRRPGRSCGSSSIGSSSTSSATCSKATPIRTRRRTPS